MIKNQLRFKLKDVYPKLTKETINHFLNDYKEFNQINVPKNIEIDKLPPEIEKLLSKVYISRDINMRSAIKARFLQFISYNEEFIKYNIYKRNYQFHEFTFDLILENEQEQVTLVYIVEVLDTQTIKEFQKLLSYLFSEKRDILEKIKDKLHKIFLVCGQIDRKVTSVLETMNLDNKEIKTEIILEYSDPEKPFDDSDRILINDKVYYGFNFGSLEDILSLIKKEMGKGKYIVFCEDDSGKRKIIWEGIIFPQILLH